MCLHVSVHTGLSPRIFFGNTSLRLQSEVKCILAIIRNCNYAISHVCIHPCMRLCLCVCVCMYAFVHVSACICTYRAIPQDFFWKYIPKITIRSEMHPRNHPQLQLCNITCVHPSMHASVSLCVCVHVCICACVCMHLYITPQYDIAFMPVQFLMFILFYCHSTEL